MNITATDTSHNTAALALAICYQNYIIPEEALNIIEGKGGFKLTEEDKEDMYKLKQEGLTYAEIGKMYGYTDTRVYKIIKRYKEDNRKKETLQGGNLSKVK